MIICEACVWFDIYVNIQGENRNATSRGIWLDVSRTKTNIFVLSLSIVIDVILKWFNNIYDFKKRMIFV